MNLLFVYLFWFFSKQGFSVVVDLPRAHSIEQAVLKLSEIHLSVSWVVGLKLYATTAQLW